MSRWIDADKLLESCIIKGKDGEPIGKRSYVSEFDIDTAHYIDIVRCKECKYWHDHITTTWCSRGAELRPQESGYVRRVADDYCSYGERRE